MLVRGYRVGYQVVGHDASGAYVHESHYDDYTFRWRAALAAWLLGKQRDVRNITIQQFIKEY